MDNYFEDVHKRAEEIAKVWYEDGEIRAEALKTIIMKELHSRGYWHFINLDKQKTESVVKTPVAKCLCAKVKELFQ